MNYNRFDEITLDNDKSYLVIDSILYENNEYLYITSGKDNYSIVKVINNNDEVSFIDVESEEIFNKIIELIIEKNKKDLQEESDN